MSMVDPIVAGQSRLEQPYDIESIEEHLEEGMTGRHMTFGEIENTEE